MDLERVMTLTAVEAEEEVSKRRFNIMKNPQKDTAPRRCNQCGADLILIKTVIEEKDLPSPVTTLIYRCSNKECQEEIDKKSVAHIKRFKEQEKAQANRYKNRSKDKE